MKPILFNTEMVRAILDGRKTMTRRIIKPQPVCYGPNKAFAAHDGDFFLSAEKKHLRCRVCGHDPEYSREGSNIVHHWKPPYLPGDILYVRETWCKGKVDYGEEPDGRCVPFISQCPSEDDFIPKELAIREGIGIEDVVWKPSIFMPKEAARIFLRVKSVRVQRLRDMVLADVLMEGIKEGDSYEETWDRWHKTWDSTVPKNPNKFKSYPYYWKDNPWVWVISFERCEKPEEVPGC